jgi:hypothetical protein
MDRYYAIPSDDAAANMHFASAVIGNGDGFISGLYAASGTTLTAGGAAESEKFWQHTRMAGFLTGVATATTASPANNALGGILGVQGAVTTYGMTGNVVCASQIPWKIALAVDTAIDDGNSNTGTVRAGLVDNTATNTAAQTVYGSGVNAPSTMDELHTVCMKI